MHDRLFLLKVAVMTFRLMMLIVSLYKNNHIKEDGKELNRGMSLPPACRLPREPGSSWTDYAGAIGCTWWHVEARGTSWERWRR
jgi:hypothetical protein